MSGIGTVLSNAALEDVLGFGISVLMVAMTTSLAIGFVCSAIEHVASTRRRVRRSNRDALSRENERLRDLLVEAQEKNDYLRKLYCGLHSQAEDRGRKAA